MAKKKGIAEQLYIPSDQLNDFIDQIEGAEEVIKETKLKVKDFNNGLLTRPATTKLIWVYIKANDLNNGRTINPDSELSKITGKKSITMFELPGKVSKHLKKYEE